MGQQQHGDSISKLPERKQHRRANKPVAAQCQRHQLLSDALLLDPHVHIHTEEYEYSPLP